ncbi:alpha-L-iduronidase [Scleropages formosus]|uniref:Alpha-L-iduronidase n=1 Tax=Scleropages formosus TaxID=113540 RepID=A0A8C9W3H3_SCLFO|nr:alpha-L-iduronidase [Scleropages formosus]
MGILKGRSAAVVLFSLLRLCATVSGTAVACADIAVDVQTAVRPLRHFWRSTGFCPPLPHTQADQYDLSRDEQLNLAYVSSVPHGGLEQVRIHWLLELVTAQVVEGVPRYNFTNLDQLIELLWQNGLRPGFELMGSVSNYFTDFEEKQQVAEWRNLVYLAARRYIEKYGLDYVSQWNFETWNEPNNHDFDNITMSIQGFLNYYDACSEGLRDASPTLRFGGPGDSCHSYPHSPYCWALLEHCHNGTNFFTGETGVRLDYIALHKKGGGGSLPILQQEVETVKEIQERFPSFRSLPVYNDEADPLVGWSKPQDWRADVTYAAMVVKVISQHQDLIIGDPDSTIHYALLSNDNAFLSYHPNQFTQRTLTARFQVNNTQPPHVQLLRKPVLTVMGLLALLGETQVFSYIVLEGSATDDTIGVLASTHKSPVPGTSDSWQSAILVYSSKDNHTVPSANHVTLQLSGFSGQKDLVYITYYLDNNSSNPYQLWQSFGSPDYPTAKQFQQLRNLGEPQVRGPLPFPSEGTLTLKVELPVPAVLLVHVCARPKATPEQVNGLRFIAVTKGQVLVVWSDRSVRSRCIKTYEVEFSTDNRKFRRINTQDSIFTSYVFAPENLDVCGFYRVRAVDYWGRPGEYSQSEKFCGKH